MNRKEISYEEMTHDLITKFIDMVSESSEEYIYGAYHTHDKLFKDVLNNQEDFKEFISVFVDNKLKEFLENNLLQPYNKSFLMADYGELESDVIFKVKNKEIYFLVEHQSKDDKNMTYRIFEYVTELIKHIMKQNPMCLVLPKVIPIVLYTGNKKWKVPKSYKEKEEKLEEYNENFVDISYKIVDINDYTVEELLRKKNMVAYAMILEKSKTKEELLKVLPKMNGIVKKEDAVNIIRIIKYLLGAKLKDDEIEEMSRNIMKKEMNEVKNVIERIMDQERMKGKREGKKEAKKEIIKQFITNMLLQGLSIETIEKCTGVSQQEILKIQKEG